MAGETVGAGSPGCNDRLPGRSAVGPAPEDVETLCLTARRRLHGGLELYQPALMLTGIAAVPACVPLPSCMHAMPECGGRFSILRRISGISRDEGDGFRNRASAVTRRVSTLGRPKLLSRHMGLPVARKSFRHRGRWTLLGAATTLSSAMTWSFSSRPAANSPTITPSYNKRSRRRIILAARSSGSSPRFVSCSGPAGHPRLSFV
jgi:hypothetical protein